MAGHSKWANIQHRKGRQDAKRSNLWTKLVREIIVAARMGGGDPESNSRLRLALIKARGGNVPKDTISNAILKGTGQLEGVSYEEIRYEGYGIGGAALIIDCTTDNRVRTVATSATRSRSTAATSARKAPSPSCSSTSASSSSPPASRPKSRDGDRPRSRRRRRRLRRRRLHRSHVRTGRLRRRFQGLRSRRIEPVVSEITYKALNEVKLTGEDAEKMQKLIDALEDLDDVQQVYTSADFDDEE